MDSISLLDLVHHSLCISLTRQDIHAECESCHSIDRNTLMDRQDISMETCNGFFVKRKNIILIFIKELLLIPVCSAASCTVLTFSESSNFFACTTFNKTSGTARSLTTKYFFFSVVFPIMTFLSLLTLSLLFTATLYPFDETHIPLRRCPFSKDNCFPMRDMLSHLCKVCKAFLPYDSAGFLANAIHFR